MDELVSNMAYGGAWCDTLTHVSFLGVLKKGILRKKDTISVN
jgi:hypothetical protein